MALRFDAEIVLRRMAQGAFAAHVAQDFGVSRQAVSKRLLRYSRSEYRQAMERGAAVRLLTLLRRCRDNGDVSRQGLKRELLYVERQAPHLLAVHASLILDAARRTSPWAQRLRKPFTGRPAPPLSQETDEDIDALERLYSRAQVQRKQTES